MKNFKLFAGALIIMLTVSAFTYSNWNSPTVHENSCRSITELEPPTLFYSLSAGSMNVVSKEAIQNAERISDLMPDHGIKEDLNKNIFSLRDVEIKIEPVRAMCGKIQLEKSNSNVLNEAQKSMLKTANYSDNFQLEGFITETKFIKDANKDRYFNYNMKVVPEYQASYKAGNDALLDFLKTECQTTIASVQKGHLKSGNIGFTITTEGIVSNIDLRTTCGYPDIDKKMMELIDRLPEGWNVAMNAKNEKIDQTLVFSYGLGGC